MFHSEPWGLNGFVLLWADIGFEADAFTLFAFLLL